MWLPTANAEVVNVATAALSVPVPMGLPPSRNVTVPVGVPAPGATGETVAVKVTDWPKTDGFADEVTAVVVSALVIVTSAIEVLPVPAVVSATVTLLLAAPTAAPCTLRETMQLAEGARVAPDKDTVPEPLVAVATPVQVLTRLLGVATTSVPGAAFGRISAKAMAFSVRFWFALLMLNVRLVEAPNGMLGTPNNFTMCGGLMTVRLSDDVLPLPASVESIVTLLL